MVNDKHSEQEKYNILFTVSSSLQISTYVCMLSALKNCNKSINFFIIEDDWTDEQKTESIEFISKFAPSTITFVRVNEDDFIGFKAWKGSYKTCYKLLAHKYLPTVFEGKNLDKILYLDQDVIVSKDIGELYDQDIDDYFLCSAVHPFLTKTVYKDYPIKYNIGKAPNYFICGSSMINLKKMRDENIDKEYYLDKINSVDYEYEIADEGILNLAFFEKTKSYPYFYYNYMLGYRNNYKQGIALSEEERRAQCNEVFHEDFDKERFASIVHFVHVPKPWNVVFDKNDKLVGKFKSEKDANDMYKYYKQWWEVADELPKHFYCEIVKDAYNSVFGPLNEHLKFTVNALHVFNDLAFDSITDMKFIRYMNSLSGKKVSILGNCSMMARLVVRCTEVFGIDILFSTSKSFLSSLTDEEWMQCRAADVLINCNIHGARPQKRDGILPVIAANIMKETHDLPELQYEMPISHDKLFSNVDDAKNSILKEIDMLSDRINDLSSFIKESNRENDKLTNENKILKAEKMQLKNDSDSTVKRLTESLNNEMALKKKSDDINKKLTDSLNQLLAKNASGEEIVKKLNEQIKNLTAEKNTADKKIKELNSQLSQLLSQKSDLEHQLNVRSDEMVILTEQLNGIQNSRSWKMTKPLRSIKAALKK